MKLEFGSKSLEYDTSNQPYRTKVTLVNADGAIMPVFLSAEKVDLSPTELLAEALEVIYQDNFPRRAENERFNEIGEKIAKYDDLIEKSQKAIEELEIATEEAKRETVNNKETVNAAVSELTELVMSLVASASMNEVENDEEI